MRYFYVVSLLVFTLLLLPYILSVKKVVCQSQFGECSQNLQKLLKESLTGTQYRNLSKKITQIPDMNNYTESYRYFFYPTGKLYFEIQEKKPEIAFKPKDGSQFYVVDRKGTVIYKTANAAYPVVYITTEQLLDSENKEFVTQLMISLARYYSVSESLWAENSLTIVYNDSIEIIFPTNGDIDVLLGSLEVMLFQLNQSLQDSKIEGVEPGEIKKIDLRYSNPVIK